MAETPSPLLEPLRRQDYAALEGALCRHDLGDLAGAWKGFKPLEKLVLFKLLDAQRAMDLYERLDFEEKYLLLCGFPLSSIAPILEDLPPAERRRFVSLPRPFYDRMFRRLLSERVEIEFRLATN